MKACKSMSLMEFTRSMRNPNWGHFTVQGNAYKDANACTFPVLAGTTHGTVGVTRLPLLEVTESKDGKSHLWYDARHLPIGAIFFKQLKNGKRISYRREGEDLFVLYV
jgi:hypothetical protein